jgi:hypothetical protein
LVIWEANRPRIQNHENVVVGSESCNKSGVTGVISSRKNKPKK